MLSVFSNQMSVMANKAYYKERIRKMQKEIDEAGKESKVLKNLDGFVLDNSLRESTVGQLRGHTIENKWKIYKEVGTLCFILELDFHSSVV